MPKRDQKEWLITRAMRPKIEAVFSWLKTSAKMTTKKTREVAEKVRKTIRPPRGEQV